VPIAVGAAVYCAAARAFGLEEARALLRPSPLTGAALAFVRHAVARAAEVLHR
jgi:hypothetical protein